LKRQNFSDIFHNIVLFTWQHWIRELNKRLEAKNLIAIAGLLSKNSKYWLEYKVFI